MNSIARTKKRVNACATSNKNCKQRHGNPYYLCVHQALNAGLQELLTLCNMSMRGYPPLRTAVRMPKQTDGGQHLRPPNILLSRLLLEGRHCVLALASHSSSSLTRRFKNLYTDPTNRRQNRVRREYFRAIKRNPLTCAYRACVLGIGRRRRVPLVLYLHARGRKLAGTRGSRYHRRP